MKVKLELELPEAETLAFCVRVVAEKSPLGLLSKPLFDMVTHAIESAKGETDGPEKTQG